MLISSISGVDNALIKVKESTDNVTTSGTTTDFSSFFPAHCIPLSITVTVTTAIGNNGYITDVGSYGDTDLFFDGLGDGRLEEEDDTVTFGQWWPVATARSNYMAAGATLRLTHANTPDAGVVRIRMVYIDGANF